jgi:metallo-beta-lactamase class B
MRRFLVTVLCGAFVLAGGALIRSSAQATQNAEAEKHVAAAKALAYEPDHDFTSSFETICAPPGKGVGPDGAPLPGAGGNAAGGDAGGRGGAAGGGRGGAGGGGGRGGDVTADGRRIPPRATWYVPPVKLFDNMYYFGDNNFVVYAVTTSDGIILLNAGNDYAVEPEVLDGMKKMGLDPANIKDIVIADARIQSYSGAPYFQQHSHPHVYASAADWDVMAKVTEPDDIKPMKDMVVTDGQKLTLGDETITMYITPGHTPGTVSMIVPVKDNGQKHTVLLLGGRDPLLNGEGVQYFPTMLDATKAWKASIERLEGISAKANADVFLITRGQNMNLMEDIKALNYRNSGAPNPLVSKEAVKHYLAMTGECMDAQLAWRSSQ